MTARGGGPGLLGLAVLAFLAALGFGGAAAAPDGVWLGAPGPGALAGGAAVVALVCLAGGARAAAACAGLALVPLVLLSGLPIPGSRALSGPPLLILVLAGVVAIFWRAALRPPRWLLLGAALSVYGAVAARVQSQVGPEGDEPHYLMVADSLLRDHDVSLEQDYAERRYAAFYKKPHLDPHYRVRGKHGEIYSLHAVGLSLLVLPAYALGGYPAVSFFMALLLAWLVLELRALVRIASESDALAEGVAWLMALSPPLLHYAGLVFSEVPAALIVALALRLGWDAERRTRLRLLGVGAGLAFLPWLNVRYAALAAILLVHVLARRWRLGTALPLALPAVVSAIAIAAYHQALYGFLDPRRVYGARPELSLATLPEGLVGLLLDQEFGLLAYAPVFVLAVPGLLSLAQKAPRGALSAATLVAVTVVVAGCWPMWRGGWNPPGRFLVPVVPALALGVAWSLRGAPKAAGALLAGFGLWTGLAGGFEPRLVHRDRDGTAPLFRAESGAEEWTRLLPRYVLSEPDRHRLAVVWGGALALAAAPWPVAGTPLAARLALASMGLLAAAGSASRLSDARTGGRDAVRLLGRPAVEVPGWRGVPSVEAQWGPEALDWGPLYEPHRHPAGALVGSRLALREGTYRLSIEVESLPGGGAPPLLRVAPDVSPLPPRSLPLVAAPQGFSGTFDVRWGERAVSLSLAAGTPFVLKALKLAPLKPLQRGPV